MGKRRQIDKIEKKTKKAKLNQKASGSPWEQDTKTSYWTLKFYYLLATKCNT